MKIFRATWLGIFALSGSFIAPVTAALDPATFYEAVGIGNRSATGSDLSLAEMVEVTLLSSEFDHRGGGTGLARAGNVMPLTAEVEVHLTGGSNLSGIGGTAAVETRFQFRIVPHAAGLPATVPLIFHAMAFVSVDSNLPLGPSGRTFARITTPFGQFQVQNYDAQGSYTGEFARQWDVPVASWQVANVGTITLQANTHGQAFGTGYGPDYLFDSRVFIDPEIDVDPTFAQAGMYSVEYSPGISPRPAAPALTITLTTTNTALVSWPSPSAGWNLQHNNDVNTTNWGTPPESVTDNGTNKFIVVNPATGQRFYRLQKP
jgi:hypothetical protein